MAHFVIAGRANDPEYAKAEMLAHHLHANLPDFHVELVPKHPDQWDEYVQTTFAQRRWAHRMASDRTYKQPDSTSLPQMIWRKSGELIGNTKDFMRMMNETYNEQMTLDDDMLSDISNEIMTQLSSN
ncbi:putative malate dehydrogenase 1B [Thoreauomyces humboldtii]|nr:putative malate dehydrogenase 1B [Thoreauomyces humboldtii]